MASFNNSTIYLEKIFKSKTELSTRESDFVNVFIFPFICLFGITTNIMNMIILFDKKMFEKLSNNLMQKYMFINSLADLLFLFVVFFLVIIRCGNLCPYGYAYGSKFYELYIYLFVGYTIVTFLVLIDISISIGKLLSFSNIMSQNDLIPFRLKCLLFGGLALILNFPNTLSNEIKISGKLKQTTDGENSTQVETIYMRGLKSEFKNGILEFFLLAFSLIKEPLLFIVLFVINIIVVYKFHEHLSKKRKLCQFSKGIFCIIFLP